MTTPDTRRMLRSITQATGALISLGLLGWIIARVDNDSLRMIGLGLVAILFVRELLHGAENVAARVKFHAGVDGVSGEIGG